MIREMKIEEINTLNISNMDKKKVERMLEKIYPIYKIPKIENLDIVLNTKMDTKHEKVIDNFQKIYEERDEIIGNLEKEKNTSIYDEITSSMTKLIKASKILYIFTSKDTFHFIDLNFFKKGDIDTFKKENQLYNNILFGAVRPKNKYLPYYFEGEKYVDFCYERIIDSLPKLFLYLNTNGNLMIYYLYPSYKIIKLYYLLNILFEEVYLIFRNIIVCKNFKNNIQHLKYITDIIQNQYTFSFSNDIVVLPIFNYLKCHIEFDLYFKNELIVKKNNKVYSLYWYILLFLLQKINISIDKKEFKMINKNIGKNENKVEKILLKNSYLLNLIKKNNVDILSVGFSNDIYELFKISKNKFKLTFIINNKLDGKVEGIQIFKTKNTDAMNVLIELFDKKRMFDYIFINTIFDYNNMIYYTMFISKILNKNGYFIINNAYFYEIDKSVIQIDKTIKHFKRINSPANIAVFQYI
jgi:hypothetical protein